MVLKDYHPLDEREKAAWNNLTVGQQTRPNP
jgi:hypothetical protein